jgi:hypothetical protein
LRSFRELGSEDLFANYDFWSHSDVS